MFNSIFGSRVISVYLIFCFVATFFIGFLILEGVFDENTAEASSIIVDSNGGGNYTTISAAVNAAKAGDTIYVWNGTYNESVEINKNNLKLIGNSSTACRISHHYIGTSILNNFAAAINVSASGVFITGFNITVSGNFTFGIRLNTSKSSYSKIDNNKISSSGYYCYGIFLYESSDNIIANNTINISGIYGYSIRLLRASNNTIINNTISTTGVYCFAIDLYDFSNNCVLSENNIHMSGNTGYGIQVRQSSNNEIVRNTLDANINQGYVIYIYFYSVLNTISNNNIKSGGMNNYCIYLNWYSEYNNLTGNIIEISGFGCYGFFLTDSSKICLQNNMINITNKSCSGIYLFRSSNNNISGNFIDNPDEYGKGINIFNSRYLEIKNNTINALDSGIDLYMTTDTNISGNNLTNCGIMINGYFLNEWNSHCIDEKNTVNSKPVYYYKNMSDIIVPAGAGEVIIANCTNMTVSNQNLSCGGLLMAFTDKSDLKNNSVDNEGIYVIYSNYNNINNNKNISYGIQLISSKNNDVIGNTIKIPVPYRIGVSLAWSSNNNFVSQNKIKVLEDNTAGIHVDDSGNNYIFENSIETSGVWGHGVYIYMASNNYVINNNITTFNERASGIELQQNSVYNNISGNNVKTIGIQGTGIHVSTSDNNYLKENRINSSGAGGQNIHILYSKFNSIISNRLNTTGSISDSIYIETSWNNSVSENYINTSGSSSYGIWLYQSANDNKLSGNNIRTSGDYNAGICLLTDSVNNKLKNNHIITEGAFGAGIAINRSINNAVSNCDVSTMGWNSNGFYLDSFNTTVFNSTFSSVTGKGNYDLVSNKRGEITVINCSFKTVQLTRNLGGVVIVKNYLGILTLSDENLKPEPNVDIQILVNTKKVYTTAGYGGTDKKTDAQGRIENIPVEYCYYYYSNNKVQYKVDIEAMKSLDYNWEDSIPDVDMSTSHTEIFVVSQNITPPVPAGLKIARMDGTNTLNISWNQNMNTERYTIYTNRSGPWTIFDNITHPRNWTLDKNLMDDKWYYYKIQCWNKFGKPSELSTVVSYFLEDITPPKIPSGFSVEPVSGGDALNISWDLNQDDTVCYDIYWWDPGKASWNHLTNITHPSNYYIFNNDSLRSGSQYRFKIRAWDKVGTPSSFSAEVSVQHRDYQPPEAPSDLEAVTISYSKIKLSWCCESYTDIEGSIVYINRTGEGSGGPYEEIRRTSSLSCTIEGLAENTTYYFVIRSFDEANNTSPYSEEAGNATFIDSRRPSIIKTIPIRGAVDVKVNNDVIIVFDMPMDDENFPDFIIISPDTKYNLNWSSETTELHIVFTDNLYYNTTYSITIGDAKSLSGGKLINAPFILEFTTEKRQTNLTRDKTITITYPVNNTKFNTAEPIMVRGISKGFDKGTEVFLTLDDQISRGFIIENNSWSIPITTPDTAGIFSIQVKAGEIGSNIIYIEIIEKPGMDSKKDTDNDPLKKILKNPGLYLGIILTIVIIVVIFFLSKRRKTTVEKKEMAEADKKEAPDQDEGDKLYQDYEEFSNTTENIKIEPAEIGALYEEE